MGATQVWSHELTTNRTRRVLQSLSDSPVGTNSPQHSTAKGLQPCFPFTLLSPMEHSCEHQRDGPTLDNRGDWAYVGTWVFEHTWELQDLNRLVYPVHVQKLLSVWLFQKYSSTK